jgi:2-C-methyl-D-erythritol 2,4-cyclodiphosphate synthase
MVMNMRVGIGYDVHGLEAGRALILGGVDIPHPTGLGGYSDADVITHAVIDALLGAAGLGDIGRHFPDNDPQYRGISSLLLLARTGEMLREKSYAIVNIDGVIMAQAPKLASYLPQMEHKLAAALGLEAGRVGLKATTTEHLGFVGRREGIAAQAVALLELLPSA